MVQELLILIADTMKDLSDQDGVAIPPELDEDTPLFGQDGVLDSMGLVSLVMAVEQAIEDKYDVTVALADAKAMSEKNSPYRTIGSLAEYANKVFQGGAS